MSQETLKIELGHWDIGTFGDINCLAKASQDEIRFRPKFCHLPLNSLNLGSKMFYSMRGIYWYPYIEIQGLKSGQNPCFELMSQCPTGPWILIWDIGTFRDINYLKIGRRPCDLQILKLNLQNAVPTDLSHWLNNFRSQIHWNYS